MEINNEVVDRVVAMNIHVVVHDTLKNVGAGMKHVGNHIADRIDELAALDLDRTDEQEKELSRLNHWLTTSSRIMDSITVGVQVNDIGYNKVELPDNLFTGEELEAIKALALNTPEMQKVMETLERHRRENADPLQEALKAMLSGVVSKDDFDKLANGN